MKRRTSEDVGGTEKHHKYSSEKPFEDMSPTNEVSLFHLNFHFINFSIFFKIRTMVFDERTLNDAKRNRPTCKSISDHMFRKLRVKKSAFCMMFWALIRTVGGQEPLMLESQKDAPVERNIKINWFSMLIQSYFSGSKHSKNVSSHPSSEPLRYAAFREYTVKASVLQSKFWQLDGIGAIGQVQILSFSLGDIYRVLVDQAPIYGIEPAPSRCGRVCLVNPRCWLSKLIIGPALRYTLGPPGIGAGC
jgi:hypothetical protein